MPGETHSAAPGTAADLSRCQGCASLQQNLNEYVDALITLKQKIINTDNLLTEYQKKCDELQFARRENSTLHHQVEQMLQKISPLQKCQEELGFLKAELEEKKSSLKLYQDTHQEYARVKEECLKTDAQKKKLEAKVKKLEGNWHPVTPLVGAITLVRAIGVCAGLQFSVSRSRPGCDGVSLGEHI